MNTYLHLTQYPQLTQTRAAVFDNAKSWMQVQRKAPFTNTVFTHPKVALTSYDRDSTLFNIELSNHRIIDGQSHFDCTAELDNNWIGFDKYGIVLSQTPKKFIIITSCGDSIADGGNFIITDGEGNYAFTTKDTSQYPVFGVTDKPNMASVFVFSWTGFKSFRKLITIFLRARYFLDHRHILYNADNYDAIKQIYVDVGQIIIKQVTGNRRENVYYRDYGFTPKKSEQFMDIHVELDDWRHPYPPFAIPPYVVKPMDAFDAKPDKTNASSNDGVDYQRAVTYESSDAAFDEVTYDNVIDAGIMANAEKVLASVAIQTYAWDKIDQAVSPIGGSNNVWPAILIINGNTIGVNFLHPIVSGSLLGSNPLFYFSKGDGNTKRRSSNGVFVTNTEEEKPVVIVDEPERMCPCGDVEGKKEDFTSESFNGISVTQIFILILFVLIIVLSLKGDISLTGRDIFEPFEKGSPKERT
jgi:hypothetical protein